MVQALVPLKDLVQAKTRLAGLLRPSERRALAQAMAEDVLEALASHPRVDRITLVSDDPTAPLLAARYRTHCWTENELGCRGLNAVVAQASGRLLNRSGGPLLVLHADLPLLSGADISAVLARLAGRGGLLVGCDRAGTGTNLLAFDTPAPPPFHFGEGSCRRHIEAARAAGLPTTLLRRDGIALDVDEPADLAVLLDAFAAGEGGGHTVALLRGTPLGERVGLALDSLKPAPSSRDSEGGG
jgi:2-phospho-L-lactate guanylyltransferase